MSTFPYACKTSDELNADTAVKASAARLFGIVALTDGTNAATVIVYDNATAASGTKLGTLKVVGADLCKQLLFSPPIAAKNGLYADVSGTGAVYYIYYE